MHQLPFKVTSNEALRLGGAYRWSYQQASYLSIWSASPTFPRLLSNQVRENHEPRLAFVLPATSVLLYVPSENRLRLSPPLGRGPTLPRCCRGSIPLPSWRGGRLAMPAPYPPHLRPLCFRVHSPQTTEQHQVVASTGSPLPTTGGSEQSPRDVDHVCVRVTSTKKMRCRPATPPDIQRLPAGRCLSRNLNIYYTRKK